jgi:hypothetical protein
MTEEVRVSIAALFIFGGIQVFGMAVGWTLRGINDRAKDRKKNS